MRPPVGWRIDRRSVTHRASIARAPSFAAVHNCPWIALTCGFGPHQSAPIQLGSVRDAEVVGSNPAVPTQKNLVKAPVVGSNPAVPTQKNLVKAPVVGAPTGFVIFYPRLSRITQREHLLDGDMINPRRNIERQALC